MLFQELLVFHVGKNDGCRASVLSFKFYWINRASSLHKNNTHNGK